MTDPSLFDQAAIGFFVRYLHVLAGIAWIGLLYYFNLVQVPGLAAYGDEGKARNITITQIATRALWWFRWAAVATLATGILITAVVPDYMVKFMKHTDSDPINAKNAVISVGMTEPDAGSAVTDLKTTATPDGDGWRIELPPDLPQDPHASVVAIDRIAPPRPACCSACASCRQEREEELLLLSSPPSQYDSRGSNKSDCKARAGRQPGRRRRPGHGRRPPDQRLRLHPGRGPRRARNAAEDRRG
jgi:hypothetical protein